MDTARLSVLAVCCLGRALAVSSRSIPLSFEQRCARLFAAHSGNAAIGLRPNRVTMGGVTLRFVHALGAARLEGVGPAAPATYIGAGVRRPFSQFPKLALRNLYPGIDAVFYGNAGRLEYDLELAPGAALSRLCLRFENARRPSLAADGSLLADAASGAIRQMPPRVQNRAIERH